MSWNTIAKHYVKNPYFKDHKWEKQKTKKINKCSYLCYECACGAYLEFESFKTAHDKNDRIDFWG